MYDDEKNQPGIDRCASVSRLRVVRQVPPQGSRAHASSESGALERTRESEAERQKLQRELQRLNAELDALARKLSIVSYERDTLHQARDSDLGLINQLKKRLEALGQNVEALTHEKGALAASMTDAYMRLQDLNRQRVAADQRAATFQSLVQKLQAMISAGQLEVVIRQGPC